MAAVWLSLVPSPPLAGAQHRFDSFTTENGLPQNSVNDILQTHDGYLWLATFGGLVRFDGVRFVIFDRSTPGIGSQRVRALHQDRTGALWAATEDGMLIRYQDQRFVTYDASDGLPHAAATRIEEDVDGCLWVTWVDRITKFDGRRFVTLGPADFGNRIAVPPVALYDDAWWTRDPEGLHVFAGGRVRTIPDASIGAPVKRVRLDRRGTVWITTDGGGLIRASGDDIRRYTTSDGLPSDSPDGQVAEGLAADVWLLDRGRLYRIRQGRAEPFTLPGAPFSGWLSLYVDVEGSTWFGTTATGLHRVVDPSITVHAERDGLSLKGAYPILQDKAGAIWVGNAALTRYANGRWTLQWPPKAIPERGVTAIYADRTGRLWVGTSRGPGYFEQGRYRSYTDQAGFLKADIVAILEDRSGALWFATSSGLVKSAGGQVTRYTAADGLSHDRITSLFEDRGGVLWIGSFQGLTRLDAGRFTAYRERDGFIGNAVRAFHEDRDGFLWVGTYDGGLYRVANERLTRFTRTDGLHDNGVFQILEDAAGYFWMGSNRGISRVSRHELNEFAAGRRRSVTAVAFGPADGLASVEVNGGAQPSGLAAADGTFWFPTMGGVAVLNPASLGGRAPPPPAIVEEVRLNGAAIDFSAGITVPRHVRSLEIRFTAPSFVKPAQVRFRYRLAGLEEEWTDAADRRSAGFHAVPPGRYRFEVVAASHDGVWNTGGPQVDIVVVPPFWRTWWFMSLGLVAMVSAALLGHEQRIRRMRRLHAMQEGFSQRLIDSQERERRRVSNEMHDSLGQHLAIIQKKARAGQQLAADPAAAGDAFGEIAALAQTANTEMTQISYAMRPHHLDTIGLSKTIEAMVNRVGRACDIRLTADIVPIDGRVPEASHIHIFRIVQEAVSNIVKHSGATQARVEVSGGQGSILIEVTDNGRGFSPDALDAGRLEMHGAGLVGIRERARILGGRVEIRSNTRTGTTLAVTIPLEDTTHG